MYMYTYTYMHVSANLCKKVMNLKESKEVGMVELYEEMGRGKCCTAL